MTTAAVYVPLEDARTLQVLRMLVRHDLVDNAIFSVDRDNTGRLFIAENCSDLWHWACADAEAIAAEDIPEYERAIVDCLEIGADVDWAGQLWACRKRKMRPQNCIYKGMPLALAALFDACGPERTDDTTKRE